MKKGVVALVVLASCGGGDGGGALRQSEREAFISNCERTSGGQGEMCGCLLEEVEERYPEPEDALDLTIEDMGELVEECK